MNLLINQFEVNEKVLIGLIISLSCICIFTFFICLFIIVNTLPIFEPMNKILTVFVLLLSIKASAQFTEYKDTLRSSIHLDTIRPRSIVYRSKQLMANSQVVRTKEEDSLIVCFNNGKIFSNMSLRPELTHLTDVKNKARYSLVNTQNLFKVEKVNTDTTFYKYTYVKLKDTLIWNNYIGYKHKFTMKDNFTGTTYTVVLYECPEIKIDPEYAKFFFGEVFFLKVPIKLHGGVIKALAEQRINDKPVMRAELLLLRFNDEENWKGGVDFNTPMSKKYTLMLPDGTRKEKQFAKELVEHLSGEKDYPTVPFKTLFDHE